MATACRRRFTGRANSAVTTGDPGRPVIDALAEVRTFAEGNGIAPAAHVVVGTPLESALAAAGWAVDGHHAGAWRERRHDGPAAGG